MIGKKSNKYEKPGLIVFVAVENSRGDCWGGPLNTGGTKCNSTGSGASEWCSSTGNTASGATCSQTGGNATGECVTNGGAATSTCSSGGNK